MQLLPRILCLSAILVGSPWAQSTWYVDAAATAPGLGTAAEPYASLQYAIDQATTLAGDTLLVAPGRYAEQIHLTKELLVCATHGPSATFLVKPAGATGAHVFLGPMDPDHEAIKRLEGFTITGTADSSIAVRLHGGTLRRCLVTGNAGLALESVFGRVERCTIADNGSGIFFATFGDTTLADSIVWGNATDVLGLDFGRARYTTFGTSPGFLLDSGPENEIADPLFADPGRGHYVLHPASPCIDTADPFLPLDPDGTRADRGALPPLRLLRSVRRR
jgi:hypothetical protein